MKLGGNRNCIKSPAGQVLYEHFSWSSKLRIDISSISGAEVNRLKKGK